MRIIDRKGENREKWRKKKGGCGLLAGVEMGVILLGLHGL